MFLLFFFFIFFSQENNSEVSLPEKVKSLLFEEENSNNNLDKKITKYSVSEVDLEKRFKELETGKIVYEYSTTKHGYVEKYLRMGNHFGKVIGLSEYYFPLFDEIFEKYKVPKELKYLTIVESKLNPTITSRAGAKGLWQFMPQTAKNFKLENNIYVDERIDPVKSTIAAAKYLLLLHKYFGDWEMVMAAYNCGEGNLMKAIKRSGGKNTYWQVRNFLPAETRGYVPSFIAANYLLNYYEEHNINVQKFKYSYKDTDTILVKNTISFDKISKKINVSLEDIAFLNPQYKLKIIPKSTNKKYYLRLPKNKIEEFSQQKTDITE
ncbi:MAG: lytic transglycosylase domain-containing protein [Solirubrobacteraceae bacterium]